MFIVGLTVWKSWNIRDQKESRSKEILIVWFIFEKLLMNSRILKSSFELGLGYQRCRPVVQLFKDQQHYQSIVLLLI